MLLTLSYPLLSSHQWRENDLSRRASRAIDHFGYNPLKGKALFERELICGMALQVFAPVFEKDLDLFGGERVEHIARTEPAFASDVDAVAHNIDAGY